MGRKLFCEISPTTYKISMEKNILQRHLKDFFSKEHFARKKSNDLLCRGHSVHADNGKMEECIEPQGQAVADRNGKDRTGVQPEDGTEDPDIKGHAARTCRGTEPGSRNVLLI